MMRRTLSGATLMPYTLEDDVRAAGAARFDGIEIWLPKLDAYLAEHSVEELDEILDQNLLVVDGLSPEPLDLFEPKPETIEALSRHAEIAAALGCRILTAVVPAPPDGIPADEWFQRAASRARDLAQAVADHDVRIAIEPGANHPLIPGPKEARRLIGEADHANLGILVDTFQLHKGGITPDTIREIPVGDLLIVHASDCDDRPPDGLTDGDRLYPGDGVVPLEKTIQILKEMGYDGPVSVEVFREEYWTLPAPEIARRAGAALRRLFDRASAPA